MSSGVEADIALDAAVVLSLGMNRLLGRAAGLAAGGADALAAIAEGRAEAREAVLREAEQHDRAIRAVLDVNARIAALETARRRAVDTYGARLDFALPEPLAVTGRPTAELDAWRAATAAALDDAEHRISAGIAAVVADQIFSIPGAAALGSDLPPAPDHAADRAETAEAGRHELAETLARVLGRVLPDATEADRAHIAEAAERLTTAGTADAAEGLLTEVRLRIQHANRNTEAARAKARLLAAEEEARRQAEAERDYVLDTITAAFGDLGYEVDTGFETMTSQDGAILLTRGDWPEHAVKMRIDAGEATLRAAMLRAGEPQSEDDRRVDAEREREWCDAFEQARARLAAAGVNSHVRWRIEPGQQQLPNAPEARRSRPRAAQRERRRERPQ